MDMDIQILMAILVAGINTGTGTKIIMAEPVGTVETGIITAQCAGITAGMTVAIMIITGDTGLGYHSRSRSVAIDRDIKNKNMFYKPRYAGFFYLEEPLNQDFLASYLKC